MNEPPLVVFDFDGVIVGGMAEYWWSAATACRQLLPEDGVPPSDEVPDRFRTLRPWVHHGWEMVLLAAEIATLDLNLWLLDYPEQQRQAMLRRGWRAEQLQEALDRARRDAVSSDRQAWLALHQPYAGVVERLAAFAGEKADWAVLTTKSRAFTAELLESLNLHPWRLDGRESGAKPDVLLQLQRERPLRAFVEDRRATLETVLKTPGLDHLPCLLVNWGYLKPADRLELPEGLHLMEPADLSRPLAEWP